MTNSYPSISSPEEIPQRFAEGWNERDADKIAAIFDEDAEFVNVVGIWWHNREQIRKAHDYGLRVIFNESTLKVGKVTVKELSDDHAVVHARMLLRNQTPVDDDEPQSRTTIFSFVAHKQADGWSCASAQNTDVVPGKETNMITPAGEMRSVNYRSKS